MSPTTRTRTRKKAPALTCDICGQTFTRQQGLTRHRRTTHGVDVKPTTTSTPPRRPATALELIEAEVLQMLAPLQKRRARIERDIARKQDELVELRKLRNYVDATIRRLSPASAKPKAPEPVGIRADRTKEAKRVAVREFIDGHHEELAEGFTGASLDRLMRAAGIEPTMSPSLVVGFLEELHELGVIRADRVTRGGGMQYLLVQTTNGKPTDGGSNGTAPQT